MKEKSKDVYNSAAEVVGLTLSKHGDELGDLLNSIKEYVNQLFTKEEHLRVLLTLKGRKSYSRSS